MQKDTTSMQNVDLLSELASQEDPFDVDLMACGCRYAGNIKMPLSIVELTKMYKLGDHELASLLAAIVDETGVSPSVLEAVIKESKVTPKKVNEIAAKIFRGKNK